MKSQFVSKLEIVDEELLSMLDELDDKKREPKDKTEEVWENDNPIKDNVIQIRRPPVKGVDYDYLDIHNPYRDTSEIDLHNEKRNWRWIETSVLKELMKSKLSGSEWSTFFSVLHRTRGFCNPKKGFHNLIRDISIIDIVSDTRMSRTTVYRSLEGLIEKKMVYQVEDNRTGKTKIGINFRYDTWDTES